MNPSFVGPKVHGLSPELSEIIREPLPTHHRKEAVIVKVRQSLSCVVVYDL
jgi:hypothetical protein